MGGVQSSEFDLFDTRLPDGCADVAAFDAANLTVVAERTHKLRQELADQAASGLIAEFLSDPASPSIFLLFVKECLLNLDEKVQSVIEV
jgi:hypothetical protein